MEFALFYSVTSVFFGVFEVQRGGDTTFIECVEVCFCVSGDYAFCYAEKLYFARGGQVS